MLKEILLFASGSVAAALSIIAYLKLNKNWQYQKAIDHGPPQDNQQAEIIEREQLSRIYAFFKDENMLKIRNAFIIVVGAGGVGSHCAFHLLRSGIGKIRLIDFDQVTLSSLNRHATATRSDVGIPKVLAMKKSFAKILPSTEIDARIELLNAENVERLLEGDPEYVVDCIDNIDTKIALLKYCHVRNIKVISSMGSACKSDASTIKISDISKTSEDALARAVRTKLRKEGIHKGIPVIFSTERNELGIGPLYQEAKDNPKEFSALPNFRVRILPVLGPLPAIFGAGMAAHVLKDIGQ
jgi:tRNA threonylcarbamoyladenosine dehydratase